uniref:Uncharacterized protein n=1 Tax=Cacopsylla melanoneura TaxID=428564 RepID=A0A8D9A3V2_9HEMI
MSLRALSFRLRFSSVPSLWFTPLTFTSRLLSCSEVVLMREFTLKSPDLLLLEEVSLRERLVISMVTVFSKDLCLVLLFGSPGVTRVPFSPLSDVLLVSCFNSELISGFESS